MCTNVDNGKCERHNFVRQGFFLEIFTIVWNIGEGIIAIVSGLASHSVALIGFGVDSLIETASALILCWRLGEELRGGCIQKIEALERKAGKLAGCLLLLLSAYIAFDACRKLMGFGERPDKSLIGLVLTVAALAVMPVLARWKRKIADAIESKALRADAMETTCCAWMAFTTLSGLVLNLSFGWWWADAVAGLVLVPLLIREGLEAIKGEECCCHCDR